MNNESATYQLSYHKLEQELDALSYDIHICDDQLGVYSTHIADMILRACMDIESISKILHARKGEDAHSTHNFFDFCCLASLALSKDCTLLAMPTQTIKEPSLRLCFPFYKDTRRDRPGNNRVNNSNSKSKSKKNNGSNDNDYRWNNAYQNLKHNKTTSLDKYGNISCLLYTMSALFLLNCRLSNSFIQSGIFCAVDVAEQVCNIPSVGGLIRPELCDADKEYCRNKVKEIECAQQ